MIDDKVGPWLGHQRDQFFYQFMGLEKLTVNIRAFVGRRGVRVKVGKCSQRAHS
jgi:hypothetical protein